MCFLKMNLLHQFKKWKDDPETPNKLFFCFIFGLKIWQSKHMGRSFNSYFKHLMKKVAVWLRYNASVPQVTSPEMMFWFEYGQVNFFKRFTGKVLSDLLSIKCFTQHLRQILILYLMFLFKTKHNLYSNEHALPAWINVLHVFFISF